MSIVDSFIDYINTEIPQFNPKWLTEEYGLGDVDHQMLHKINQKLGSVDINFKRKATMYLPDLNQVSNKSAAAPAQKKVQMR